MREEIPSDSTARGVIGGMVAFLAVFAVAFWRVQRSWIDYEEVPADASDPLGSLLIEGEYARLLLFDVHRLPLMGHDSLVLDVQGIDLALLVVPPLCLFAAGYWTVSGAVGRGGFVQGAKVTASYLLFVTLGALSIYGMGSSFQAVVGAGVVFPVAFGGLGGLVAAEIEHRRSVRRREIPSREGVAPEKRT